ncbi:hydrolase, alpha/beta domain protein, partial [Dictyocaulus viviparus]
PEVARYFGYAAEVHLVRTDDDYILEVYRILPRRNLKQSWKGQKPLVFLQHGIFGDGFAWASNIANESAAFVFADAGVDVWIGNSRGTPPSQKHISYGPNDRRFWNFTWQDMASYDLTSSINYVLEKTGEASLYYVGHSQGTEIMFAKLAEDQRFASKIRQFHALAPVATVSHIGGLFRIFGHRLTFLVELLLRRTPNSPLTLPKFLQKTISYFCSLPIAQGVCTLDIGIFDGKETMMNTTRIGVYLCHTPAATSAKNLLHWVQIVNSRKCEKFDYGREGNIREYGKERPPTYDFRKITVPTYLYWSKDDILADTEDIRETILTSMNATIRSSYELPHYTHLDFVFGINATHDIYHPIIDEIRRDLITSKMLRENRVYA